MESTPIELATRIVCDGSQDEAIKGCAEFIELSDLKDVALCAVRGSLKEALGQVTYCEKKIQTLAARVKELEEEIESQRTTFIPLIDVVLDARIAYWKNPVNYEPAGDKPAIVAELELVKGCLDPWREKANALTMEQSGEGL